MYKDYRYINAGENEIYRWGHKAQEKAAQHLQPNEKGFYSIPADGGKYWTIGTSTGKYGEFAKFGQVILSVNSAGFVWAKVGTEKADAFVAMVNKMIDDMKKVKSRNAKREDDEEEDDEE